MFLESCSTPAAAPEPVVGWYEGTLYEDKPFYITKNAISWTSGRTKLYIFYNFLYPLQENSKK